MVLHPAAQPQAVGGGAYGGESLPWMPNPFPQVLQTLPEAVDREYVDDAQEVSVLGAVDDVEGVPAAGKQPAVLHLEVLQFRRVREGVGQFTSCLRPCHPAASCL